MKYKIIYSYKMRNKKILFKIIINHYKINNNQKQKSKIITNFFNKVY